MKDLLPVSFQAAGIDTQISDIYSLIKPFFFSAS